MDDLLACLRKFDALRDSPNEGHADKVQLQSLPNRAPELADPAYVDSLPLPLREALKAQAISRLYRHQAEAIDSIRAGDDVVLEAPTASGKTLSFNIPLLLALADQPNAHALMLHPMKALSNDQRRQFEGLAHGFAGSSSRKLDSWIFDGDREAEERKLIKANPPAVLFTNPEMLHQSFLGWQQQWESFLRGLRMLIIDEIHEYRGYFGTNIALLMRRFFAALSKLDVRPQLVLATATCGNPEEHAYRLTGRRCKVVRATTTMRPERHFAFIEPDIPDYKFYDIYRLRIARAALACLSQGLSTLIFCPSRKFAEEAARQAQNEAQGLGIDPAIIAPYRSGYKADDRRKIEDGLRNGRYRAVFSTNALEIGIDIGQLDACILAGFPDNVLSAWQRIGRVGRNWNKKAYVLFYAFNNPFDRFFASNINAFLNKPLDEILIGADNDELMGKHLPYLAYEMKGEFDEKIRKDLGDSFFEFARSQTANTKPLKGYQPKYQKLSIRGGSGVVYTLKNKIQELGTISDVHKFREAYVGAIYNHFGRPYKVMAHGADYVELEEAEPHLRTEPSFYTVTQGAEIFRGFRYAESLVACYGRVTIFENFAGFKVVNTRSGEVTGEQKSNLARPSNVRGFWFDLSESAEFRAAGGENRLFGLEQLLRIGAPFVVPCDRHDMGTLTNGANVYLYETVPGGIGVAEKCLDVWREIVKTAVKIAESCSCKNGCPSCLTPPRLPVGFDPPKKDATIAAAGEFLQLGNSSRLEKFDPNLHAWVPFSSNAAQGPGGD